MNKEQLKEWRTGHGFTRLELAGVLGVSATALAYWEWGKRRIPPLLPLALEALENRFKAGGGKNGLDR